MIRRFTLAFALMCCAAPAFAQQPALLISAFLANPNGADDNKEFVELTATRAIDFSLQNYSVVFSDGSIATAANGWVTGGSGTYGFNITSGTAAKGQKIYVGGNAAGTYLSGGTACISYTTNTTTGAGAAFGNGLTGTGASAGVLGNGGSNADGLAVFSSNTSALTNTSIPIDAIFFGTGVGNATGKFILPTNDRYSNAAGKFGVGTNTYIAPDPGSDAFISATGAFDTLTNTFITARTWTGSTINTTTNKVLCSAASSITLTAQNNLSINANTATTTAFLAPPDVSGVISDPTDPAATLGINLDIKDNGANIPAANYTLNASSSNTAVVANTGITITQGNGMANVKINPAGVGYSLITLTLTKSALTQTYVINYAASAASTGNTVFHTGYSDGSSANALDNNFMVVVDDEKNDLNVYSRNASGLPVKTYSYGSLLNLTDLSGGVPREVDLEALAPSVANTGRLYYLGSMSNQSGTPFNDRPNRDRLFATMVSGTGAATSFSFVGYYAGLRNDLINWGTANSLGLAASAAAGTDPKNSSGFNLEGMAFAPDNTTMYIGFRAPLLPVTNRINALVAPVQNFETWFDNGSPAGSPVIGTPILLDLAGRGIRELYRQDATTILIIAGDVGSGTLQSQIYKWNGNATDAPVLLSGFNATGLNPEGMLNVYSSNTIQNNQLQLISDLGDVDFYNDGTAAKDLSTAPFKKFRSDLLTSPGQPLPVRYQSFDAFLKSNKHVQLSWNFQQGDDLQYFEIQRSANGADFSAAGTVTSMASQKDYSFDDSPAELTGTLYYRIKAVTLSGQNYYTNIRQIAQNTFGPGVQIYPNPIAGNWLTVTTGNTAEATYRIISISGQEVLKGSLGGGSGRIDVSALVSGTYRIELYDVGQLSQSSFLKQ